MSSSLEVVSDTGKLPYSFTQEVLREVRSLRVYPQIEKLRRNIKNKECLEFLSLVKTVLAAQISMKYAAKGFEEKAGYDRSIASVGRLFDQFSDDKRYNNDHRMYAYYALKKRCDELMQSYLSHLGASPNDVLKMVREESYTIKYMASTQSEKEEAPLPEIASIEIEVVDFNERPGLIAKIRAGTLQLLRNNFDVPRFMLTTQKSSNEQQINNNNNFFRDFSFGLSAAISKTKDLLFNNLIEEKVSVGLAPENTDGEENYLGSLEELLSFESSVEKNISAKRLSKSKAASKKKVTKAPKR